MARVYSLDPDFEQDSDSRPPVSNYVVGAADTASPVSTPTSFDAAAVQESLVEYAAPVAPALIDEVTFLSGLNPDGTLAFYSYAAWNEDSPATYTGGYTLSRKWFADAGASIAGTPGGTVSYGFNTLSVWTADEVAAFVAGLALWSAVADISFTLTADYSQAGIRFVRGSDDKAFASYATVQPTPADAALTDGTRLLQMARATISIDTSVPGFGQIGAFSGANNIFTNYGGHPLRTILHEIGHALGLGHGGPYNGSSATKTQQYGAYDNTQWTIMSYIRGNDPSTPFWGQNPSAGTAAWGTTTTSGFLYSRGPATWMPADLLAIQRIYGAAVNTPLSNVTFGYNTTITGPVANFFDFTRNTTPIVTLWAAGTSNTLDLSGTSDATVNLNPGTFSSTHGLTNNIAIAYDTRIGRLVGSAGRTTATGNDDGNYIDGAGGDDVIHGGNGDDTLLGGTGADRIYGGNGTNAINGGSESDTAGYALARSAYAIARNGDGSLTVTGQSVTDTLREIEFLEFSDQTIAVTALGAGAILGGDVSGTGGQQMPTLDEQVTYITGVTSTGVVAPQTSKTWDSPTNPPTYGPNSNAGKWGASNIAGTGGGTINYYFHANETGTADDWNAAEQNVFNSIFALYAAIANISFSNQGTLAEGAVNPTSGIILRRGTTGTGAFASTSLVTSDPAAGTVNGTNTKLYTIPLSTINIETTEPTGSFNIDDTPYALFTRAGGHPWTTALHEVGHALGLGHAGPYPATGSTPEDAQYSEYDSEVHTVMSYIHPADPARLSGSYPVTANWGTVNNGPAIWKRNPVTAMPLDILALQRLYGTPTNSPFASNQTFGFNTTLTGDIKKFYDFNINTHPVVTIWSSASGNTLDLSGFNVASTVNLTAGSYSSVAGLTNNIAIAYNTAINTAIGGSGHDTITGNNNGNTLKGGSGNDGITGGTGADTLWGDAGTNSLNGGNGSDTARYLLARSDYVVVRNANNSLTVTGTGITDTLTAIEFLTFSDQTVAAASFNLSPDKGRDFNGDTKTDILLRNVSTGDVAVWLMDGLSVSSTGTVGTPDLSWSIGGASDFNGDGKSDLLFRNTNGQSSIWLMNGATFTDRDSISTTDTNWSIAATRDFNGDGKGDILWRNTNGQSSIWLMNGMNYSDRDAIATTDTNWNVAGTGDFNGDGKADILWRNNNGQTSVWLMNGLATADRDSISVTDTAWSIVGTGDFNGDGKADILWRNTNGQNSIWLMNGLAVADRDAITALDTTWQAKSTGDFNSDGKADILWQKNDGQLAVWTMSGLTMLAATNVGSNPGTSWQAATG